MKSESAAMLGLISARIGLEGEVRGEPRRLRGDNQVVWAYSTGGEAEG